MAVNEGIFRPTALRSYAQFAHTMVTTDALEMRTVRIKFRPSCLYVSKVKLFAN